MPLVRSVFSKALWERRFSILYWLAGFAAIGAMVVAVYPAFRDSEALKEFLARFPPAMMSMLGIDPTSFTTGIGFVQAQLYSFLAPIVLIAFTVPAGAAATAREEEDGTADLLLRFSRWRSCRRFSRACSRHSCSWATPRSTCACPRAGSSASTSACGCSGSSSAR
ncbi:MAG: hypothetical protein ACYTF8_15450 [Planctomycetota bacterium]|jgi:hypothetical protein